MSDAILTLVIWRETGKWVGQAEGFDIGVQADTLDGLVERFEIAAGIELQKAQAENRDMPPYPTDRPSRLFGDFRIPIRVSPIEVRSTEITP